MTSKKKTNNTLPTNLKNDVAYLEVAATSAPTAKERAWARRQLKRIRK